RVGSLVAARAAPAGRGARADRADDRAPRGEAAPGAALAARCVSRRRPGSRRAGAVRPVSRAITASTEGELGQGAAVRIGTRGSALALAQATLVAQALQGAGASIEIVTVETAGDRRAPDTAWGEGAFVAAIQRALLEDRVDVAVHSAKDVPTDSVEG